MRPRLRFAVWGIVLGLGAPLGSLLLRVLQYPQQGILDVLTNELQAGRHYYVYMTFGTTLAFGVFAYVLGRLNENLSDLSVTDGLTGLYNHRYLQEQLKLETQRSDRYAVALTCLMIDIDDFKKVNDRQGHIFGDKVLSGVAGIIQSAVRKTDLVGRYGGEEFVVIMPQTDGAAARLLAERILKLVRDSPFLTPSEDVHVTVSIGLATYPELEAGVKTKDSLLSAADQAMYQAKIKGKNQIVVWQV